MDYIRQLKTGIAGTVIVPDDAGYDEARSIWNAMIDKRPAVIVQCSSTDDVVQAVSVARESGAATAVRGCGHNIAGNSICDDGIVIDLSAMNTVEVDASARRAYVGPGATLGDFDAAAQSAGLATTLGINSTTGVAGLTLGGGFGWLSRKYGHTVDNLLSAEVVTAGGDRLTASADENQDLFWGIRGGGGNLGIVTRFEFQMYPVGPEITAGLIVYPLEQAEDVLKGYRDFVATAPEDMTIWVVLRKAPPLPFLPEAVHGKEVVVLACFYDGDSETALPLLEPLKGFGTPHGVHLGPTPYAGWQQAFDPLLTPGARNYWKSHNFASLSDGLFDATIAAAANLPSPQCEIFIAQLGGAAGRVSSDAMAYAHRDADFVMNVHGRWDDAADDDSCISWARTFFKETEPFATGGVYVNFMPDDEAGRVKSAYGANYQRMVDLKRKYDPTNLFRLNQNVAP
jgi:FAD/FMN-containing dehydrogenase